MTDSIAAVEKIIPVSRETAARLERYVALLRKWQPAQNLVSPHTLGEIWTRHIADSAQLVALFPGRHRWVDIGSGAGLPGIVTGILLADVPGARVHCVESNQRKCAYLRTAIRETGAAAVVHEGRIESVLKQWQEPADLISARALASLANLLGLMEPVMAKGVGAALHKGEDFDSELQEASQSWALDLVRHKSLIDPASLIVEIRHAERRSASVSL
jgi:16S rRNA (guanine527-N7)-methyltransferase